MRKKKSIICRDSQGRVIIDTKIALASLIITILLVFASIVAISVNAQSDIQYAKKNINDFKEKIEDHEQRITTIETHYIHISDSLDRIENKIEEENEI